MSCLLLKTSELQKDVFKATHEDVIGEKKFGGILERRLCWSMPDQPPCMVHEDSREGNGWKESSLDSVQLQAGIRSVETEELQTCTTKNRPTGTAKNGCNQDRDGVECGNDITKPASDTEQKQAWEMYIVDELVTKLVSQLSFLPESSTPCFDEGEDQGLNVQEDATSNRKTSSCVGAKISETVTSQYVEEKNPLLPIGLPELSISRTDSHSAPAKLKSALRGGHETLGLGPRPRMHVTWAPDVYDPPCTSTSHTKNQNCQRHHQHQRGDHKNRHRGKGSSRADSHKKSQKKLLRRLKHANEFFPGASTALSQKGMQGSTFMLKEYIPPSLDDFKLKGLGVGPCISPSLDDFKLKSSGVGPFISLQKACFLSPVLSIGECELVSLDKIPGCHPRPVQTHKRFV